MVFAIHQHESVIGLRLSPPSSTTSPHHLPPHLIPPGCHRAPALGALHHVSNSHWLSILHMEAFMFQYYSLKSSHPLLLPNEWIRKLWYIYTMKYYSAIKGMHLSQF